jgi:hypothetical protein
MRQAAKLTVESLAFLAFATLATERGVAEENTPPTVAEAEDDAAIMQLQHGGGMWAYYVPKGLHGEFDSYDPIGLIAGDLIKADCSVTWADPKGRLYCFSSEPSLIYFEDLPQANLKKAREAWQRLKPQS